MNFKPGQIFSYYHNGVFRGNLLILKTEEIEINEVYKRYLCVWKDCADNFCVTRIPTFFYQELLNDWIRNQNLKLISLDKNLICKKSLNNF